MTVTELPLPSLVDQCLDGEQPAFSELLRRYRAMVFGLCFRMLRHREDAEDATQETFVRVANNLHRWDNQRSFEPWLMTIAGNRCRTRLAFRARHKPMAVLDEPVAGKTHLENDARLLAEEVDQTLVELRQECRVAFEKFYREELPYATIAQQMNVPLGTIKTWVHRARKELISRLRERGTIGG